MKVVFTWAGARRGFGASVPLMLGLIPYGVVTGLASQRAGLSAGEAALMSGVVYAGAAQLVALAHWTHPAAILPAVLAAFTVNARLLLMGPALTPWLSHLRGWRLGASLFVMADQNWALSVDAMERGEADAAFLLGGGAAVWVLWLATTLAGFAAGGSLRLTPGHPLFFAALAIFVCLLSQMWRGSRDALPWLVAAVVGVGVARVEGGGTWHIVAGALAGGLAGAARDRAR